MTPLEKIPIQIKMFYILVLNGIIFTIAIFQNWNPAELFLFFFLQSLSIGIIALTTLILISTKKLGLIKTFFHSIFFISHYFFVHLIIIFGIYYNGSDLNSITLNSDININHLLLPLIFFIGSGIGYYFLRFNQAEKDKYSLSKIHISPYPYHIFVFGFIYFLISIFLIITQQSHFSEVNENQVLILVFFMSITIIDSLTVYLQHEFE